PSTTLSAGQAMRIMTGAPVPDGADTVVQQELCDTDDDHVIVNERPSQGRGAYIRRTGSYMRKGHGVLHAGDFISPGEVSTLASFHMPVVDVVRRPTVAIVSTGDELVDLGQEPGPGQIVNSNAYMLEALLRRWNALPIVFPIARDSESEIRGVFEEASECADIVVSSGGVSVGDFDFVKVVLDELTGGMNFWKVRLKPGKPLAFGTMRGERPTPFIGLPGNPASSFVGFHLFVRPALAVAQGIAPELATAFSIRAHLGTPTRAARGRTSYLAGRLERHPSKLVFYPVPDQSSGNPTLFCRSNGLAIIEPDAGTLPEGTPIDVILLDG
ncbi:MAG: molybdopterin molybdotransferase MoeA, partial [Bradymonadaceae bacterium]